MRSPRIFFVNRFYWPDEPATAQLLTDLTRGLAQREWTVVVVTSRPKGAEAPAHETKDGVIVERVWTTRLGQRSLAGRTLDFLTFYLGASWTLFRRIRQGDIVVALTDPPLIGVVARWIAAWRGAQMIHWVQDIYPEVAVEVTGQRALLIARPVRNAAWRKAISCVAPGVDMARALTDAGVSPTKVVMLPNWAPAGLHPASVSEVTDLRRAWGLSDKFVIAYSGNLGRVHDLDPILDVAAILRNELEFVFLFIGGGAQRAAIESAVHARQLNNVRFQPAQPRERLATSLGVGDVHFVTLRPGADRWVFPSKLYGIAAIGRATIFVGARDCEIARIVRDRGIGTSHTREESAEIAAQLRHWRANPSQLKTVAAAAQLFADKGADFAVQRWHELLTAKLAETNASR